MVMQNQISFHGGRPFFCPYAALHAYAIRLSHGKHKMVEFTINYRLEQVGFQLQQESKTAGKSPRGGTRTKGVNGSLNSTN